MQILYFLVSGSAVGVTLVAHKPLKHAMTENINQLTEFALKEGTYSRYMNAFEALKARFSVDLHVSQEGNALELGDIFLFNHFTRMETTFPPYIIYRHTGKLTRSVAHYDLFSNETFGNHLRQMGAVPSNMPGLLPFLAKEILRGRKVVIFPEGGIVRDKKVLDDTGNYNIFSSSAGKVRQHHKGAAALAVTLDMLKHHLKTVYAEENEAEIIHWCQNLRLSKAELLAAISKPTLLVPGTITYYPLRNRENLLVQGVEKFLGKLPASALDDLIIESNIVLNRTDMSLHFGAPMHALKDLSWADKLLINRSLSEVKTVEELFETHENASGLSGFYIKRLLESQTENVRAEYARRLYLGTVINFNHLTAITLSELAHAGYTEISKPTFYKMLYLGLKSLQSETGIQLHCTLTRVGVYQGLLEGKPKSLHGFMQGCVRNGLVIETPSTYQLTPLITAQADFNNIRLENPVQVHVNEASPIKQVQVSVKAAILQAHSVTEAELARLRFNDEQREYEGQRHRFTKKAPQTVIPTSAEASGRPYLLLPKKTAKVGVLMVHGFAALPSEFQSFAENIHAQGNAVLAMRLPGHGTSYLDMEGEGRSYLDWLQAVRTNYEILAAHVQKVVVVGFSTGAVLGLQLAAEKPHKLAGIASISAPYAVQDPNMKLLPFVMPIRPLLLLVPGLKGLLSYYKFGDQKSPHIYHTVPVTAINQLRLLIKRLASTLPQVQAPTLLLQGTADETVKASSAQSILQQLGAPEKELVMIENAPHALIRENIGITWKELKKFIRLAGER